jgi:hypothetical protein
MCEVIYESTHRAHVRLCEIPPFHYIIKVKISRAINILNTLMPLLLETTKLNIQVSQGKNPQSKIKIHVKIGELKIFKY